MKINILFLLLACTSFCVSRANNEEKTFLIRAEAVAHTNPNITKKTHPTLYALVHELALKASVEMPRYITLFDAEFCVVNDDGVVRENINYIKAYADLWGDLHICREILLNLSYEEIKGIVAVAIAEKAISKPARVTAVGFASYAITLASLYCYYKPCNAQLSARASAHSVQSNADCKERLILMMFGSLFPALIASNIYDNSVQKMTDLLATHVVDTQHIIAGIEGIEKLTDAYRKEFFLTRLAHMLNAKELLYSIFYPIRAYTPQERIKYLQQ